MTTKNTCAPIAFCGVLAPKTGWKPWLKLVLGFVAVWGSIFVFGTLARFIPGADHMAEVIDERGLRATAIYYTDLEESYEGSETIRHSLEYTPGKERLWESTKK
jgi:hypothetical protein